MCSMSFISCCLDLCINVTICILIIVFICVWEYHMYLHPVGQIHVCVCVGACVCVCVCVCVCKIHQSCLQNGRWRISLSSIWRNREIQNGGYSESSSGKKTRKWIKRRGKLPGCLVPPVSTWKKKETKTHRRLGRLEKGNRKERKRGRGGEEEEESWYVRSPKRHICVWSRSAGTSSSIDIIENPSPGKRLEWKETFDTGNAGREGALIRRICQHGDTEPQPHRLFYLRD